MDYSEFLRHLGADPHSRDSDFLLARESAPEFQRASEQAEAFEAKLLRAAELPAPDGLLNDILKISQDNVHSTAPLSRWWPAALAASILVAVGAAGIGWKMNRSWDSVDQYVVEHYHHDGQGLLEKSGQGPAENVQLLLSRFDIEAAPAMAQLVNVIKYCPTPDGKGVHMVLNTEEGPVTLIYMPETQVNDHETIEFDDMRAMLVGLETGSAIIIGTRQQNISALYSFVQESFIPAAVRA